MKILILGAGGMAGHLVTTYLLEKKHDVLGFTKKPLYFCEFILGDALDKDSIKKAVFCSHFDVVINCIGVLNTNVERNMADGIFLNSYLSHYISECLKEKTTKFIHLSTDCVFSGKTGKYTEDSYTDSDTPYGRTKALGEINYGRNLTIRTSIVGPDLNENGIGLLNWFLKQKEDVKGYKSAIWTGISTVTLARGMEYAIEKDLCGLYHLVNNDAINKYELLKLFNDYVKTDKIQIQPDDSAHVIDKSLINTRKDFDFIVPSYIEMAKEIKQWIWNHKQFYPHYF